MSRSLVKQLLRLGVLFVLIVAVVSGADILGNSRPGFNAALSHSIGNDVEPGGKLRLGTTSDCDSYDPALTVDSWCGVVHRLYSRNLLAYAARAGKEGKKTVPDLAIDQPVVNADKTKWTFTLRPGIKWNDGKTLTSEDVRYSFERLFDPKLDVRVANSTLCLLTECPLGVPLYKGPSVGKLRSIKTPDKRTVVITLNRPFADFNYVVASPQFAAVQKSAVENSVAGYRNQPSSSGPFVVSDYVVGRRTTFTRNKYWKQEQDSIRLPKVKTITLTVYPNAQTLDAAIRDKVVDLKVNSGLDQATRDRLLSDEKQAKLLDNPLLNYTNFIALVPAAAPLDKIECREAIALALNKAALVKLRGGDATSFIATSMTAPGVEGFDPNSNRYPSGDDGTGNLKASRKKLAECGNPGGFEVTMAYAKVGIGPAQFEMVRKALARVGIVVNPKSFATASDYLVNGVGSPDVVRTQGIGIIASGWGTSTPSPLGFWSPLADGRAVRPFANMNYPEFSDDEVNALLDSLEFGTNRKSAASVTRAIESRVMDQAVFIPYAYDRILLYRPGTLGNVYIQQALGNQYDLVNIGLVAKN